MPIAAPAAVRGHFTYRAFTPEELAQGYALEYQVSWRDIVANQDAVPAKLAEILDTLDTIPEIANFCCVEIVDGMPVIRNWDTDKRMQELEPWLDEACDKHEIITKPERIKLRVMLHRACESYS